MSRVLRLYWLGRYLVPVLQMTPYAELRTSRLSAQLWLLSSWLGSHRASHIFQAIYESKGSCVELIKRLKEAGLVSHEEETMKALESCNVFSSPELQRLKSNKLLWCEMP